MLMQSVCQRHCYNFADIIKIQFYSLDFSSNLINAYFLGLFSFLDVALIYRNGYQSLPTVFHINLETHTWGRHGTPDTLRLMSCQYSYRSSFKTQIHLLCVCKSNSSSVNSNLPSKARPKYTAAMLKLKLSRLSTQVQRDPLMSTDGLKCNIA